MVLMGCGGAADGPQGNMCETGSGSFTLTPTADYAVRYTDESGAVRVQATNQSGPVQPCAVGSQCFVNTADGTVEDGVCH